MGDGAERSMGLYDSTHTFEGPRMSARERYRSRPLPSTKIEDRPECPSEREPGNRMASRARERDTGERQQDQIARIRRDARKDADKGQKVRQKPSG